MEQQDDRREVNLLFTSAGRRVELIRAFRRAYRSLGLRGRICATDINPLAPALQMVDTPCLVPPFSSPDYVPSLVEICRKEAIGMVFPLIDPDIPILAGARHQIEATGARLAVVSEAAAEIAADKWETTRFFRDMGLRTPASWLPERVEPDALAYPCFIKPRRGSASQHAFPVRNERELLFFRDYVPDPILQEYLRGPEITNDVICDLEGGVLAVVSRRRIETRSGEVSKGVTVYDAAIHDACVKIAHALPAVGPITVQCILQNGEPHFTEINARFGGGSPLGIAAGVDSPRMLLARAAGIPVLLPVPGSYRVGLHLTRFDDSFFLTDASGAGLVAGAREAEAAG